MLLALDCPTKMLERTATVCDFLMVSALRCAEDESYKKFHMTATLPKILNMDCPINPVQGMELASEVGAVVVCTDDPFTYKNVSVMGIIRGKNPLEALTNINWFLENKLASIAVPYNVCMVDGDTPEVMGLRRQHIVSLIPTQIAVHLLGFVSLNELSLYESRQSMSINTGEPIALGLKELSISEPLQTKVPSYEQFKGIKPDSSKANFVWYNVAIMRKYL